MNNYAFKYIYYFLILLQDGSNYGRSGFDSRQRQDIFSSLQCPDRLWARPASYSMRTGGSFPGDKAAGA
jgi:hypothetical protein